MHTDRACVHRGSTMGDVSNPQLKRKGEEKASKSTKKIWTPKEDAVLIAALSELCNSGWKRQNGIFKSGYTSALETKLKSRLPNCNIKASPHIESRLKLLKRQYDAITEMQGTAGIQWNDKENTLVCEDDDVWNEWVQMHTDAKGLRNKQFPYYNDLHILFGNRGTRKGITNEVVDDSFEEEGRGNLEAFSNGSFDREVDLTVNTEHYMNRKVGQDLRTDRYKKKTDNYNRSDDENHSADDVIRTEKQARTSTDQHYMNRNVGRVIRIDRYEDSGDETNRSDDENLSADDVIRTEKQARTSAVEVSNKKNCGTSECGKSSEVGEMAKIFGSFLDKYQEHISLLSELIGREKNGEKIASEKRARVNEELTKLPNLSLQARLQAASLIVSDPAKIDLFYSLSKDERREWVSMLLSGLL